MKSPATFPHKVEQLAAWNGVIYKSTSKKHVDGRHKTYEYFKLVYRIDGKRKTLGFDCLDATMKGCSELVKKLGKAKAAEVVLSNGKGAQYTQAMESLAELPDPPALNIAIAEYVALKKLIGDVPAVEVGRFYVDRRGLNLPARTVKETVDEMIKVKQAEELSARHIKDLENRLARFAKDFQCQVADVDAPKLSAWLRGLGLSPRSQNNFRTAIQTLMTFAKSCGYLPRDWDELESVPRAKDKKGDVKIFTPDEISKLLTTASDRKYLKLLPFVAVGAFAGLRSAEIERLTWNKIDLRDKHIEVDADITKTHSRRIVPIQPNLAKWLAPHVKKAGMVCECGNVTNELLKLAQAAGVEWKQNGLRHSFGSYRTAATRDFPRVAYEMGNSPAMIKEHYHQLVKPKQAATWFAIKPGSIANVVDMPAAAAA